MTAFGVTPHLAFQSALVNTHCFGRMGGSAAQSVNTLPSILAMHWLLFQTPASAQETAECLGLNT